MIQQPALPIDAADETYWAGIRRQYNVPEDFINLENGYFSVQSKPVFDAFQRYHTQINREGAYFLREKIRSGWPRLCKRWRTSPARRSKN